MRAMILAAGRGERMRPLTDTVPKPLLQVGDKPLILWHIERLVQAGIHDIIINHAWLGQQIEQALGNGSQFGANISYSPEAIPLETAGGIAQALPFFQDQPFLVINGDIWCDWDISKVSSLAASMQAEERSAGLLLVNNPEHHPSGDFVLEDNGLVTDKDKVTLHKAKTLTFSGIGIYQPTLFQGLIPGQAAALSPLLRQAMDQNQVGGALHTGAWTDVGTPQRLHQLNHALSA